MDEDARLGEIWKRVDDPPKSKSDKGMMSVEVGDIVMDLGSDVGGTAAVVEVMDEDARLSEISKRAGSSPKSDEGVDEGAGGGCIFEEGRLVPVKDSLSVLNE